MVAETDLYWL